MKNVSGLIMYLAYDELHLKDEVLDRAVGGRLYLTVRSQIREGIERRIEQKNDPRWFYGADRQLGLKFVNTRT